jgi:hypothetical protein
LTSTHPTSINAWPPYDAGQDNSKGKLTRWEILRCRVRYFCDGAVLGTKDFVNGIFEH